MRILMLTDWPRLQGGGEAHLVALRDALERAGDDVRLLAGDVNPAAREAADYPVFADDSTAGRLVLQLVNPLAAWGVRRAVRDFRPDVALVNMFALHLSPAAVFALGHVPYVLLVSDFKIICPLGHRLLPDRSVCRDRPGAACRRNHCLGWAHWMREQPRYRLIHAVADRAAATVAISDHLRESLESNGIPATTIHLFSPPPGPDYRRRKARRPTLLYVGRLDVEKGVDTLIRAFARARNRVPDLRLRVVGQGVLRQELEELVADLGLAGAVDFLGWQEPPVVERELSRAWALVAPSRWPEPFGLVALEALQRGVPAIVTAGGGFAEQVRHGETGLLFEPDDVDSLAEHLHAIGSGASFGSPELDPALVRRIRERFSEASHATKLRAVLGRAAGISLSPETAASSH